VATWGLDDIAMGKQNTSEKGKKKGTTGYGKEGTNLTEGDKGKRTNNLQKVKCKDYLSSPNWGGEKHSQYNSPGKKLLTGVKRGKKTKRIYRNPTRVAEGQ